MQKVNKHTQLNEKKLCKVCGSELSNGVCSTCGWVQIIFPCEVPSEIAEFNAQREETAKSLYKESCKSKSSIKKLEEVHDTEISKREIYQKRLEEAKEETRFAKSECERYKTKIVNTDKELAALKNKNQELTANVQRISSQNQSLVREKEKALAELELVKKNLPISAGAQIRIAENNGKYILYDASGVVRRSNGNVIGKSGIELYDGYIFHIGELSFKVNAPEFNLDNLIL